MSYFVKYNTILDFGVSNAYLKKALSKFRSNQSSKWENKKDPNDKRKVLINLDSIPERTKIKYNIPSGKEYQQQQNEIARLNYEAEKIVYEKEKALQEKQFKKEELFKANAERNSLIDAYSKNWFQYLDTYRDWYSHNPKRCEELAEQSAKDHAFWIRMLDITGTQYKAFRGKITIGFEHYTDLKNRIKLTTKTENLIHFRRIVKELRESRSYNDSLFIEKIAVKNTKPNNNRTKTDEFHKGLALSILSHPKIYAYRVVTDLMNHHCKEEGKPTITESWVKNLMSKENKFKTLVNSFRYGAKHFDDLLLPHAVRKKTTYPGNVWMIDGSPVQMYCYNESKTKLVRLNLFAIIDVCTRKIVGYDIALSEDRYTVMQALKIAVTSEGHLPAEIVSDNFSANKTDEILDLKSQMTKMGVYWRHSKVGNAKDKSYIERYFGVFQTVEQSLYDDYIGEGITSKRLNARPNKEFLQKIAKDNPNVTTKQMMHRISVMVKTYNNRVSKENNTPSNTYKELPKPNVKEMNEFTTALMFWNKTKHTVKRGMVKIKVRKTEHVYEIYEHDLKAELQGKTVVVRYDPKDLDSIMLFDIDSDSPICECRKSIAIHTSIADRTEEDELNTAIIEAKKKSYQQHIQKSYDEIINKGLKAVGKDEIDIIHPLTLSKNNVNAIEDDLHRLFLHQNNISEQDEEKREYKPIKRLKRSDKETDAHVTLLQKKEPSVKGSLKVVGKTNH